MRFNPAIAFVWSLVAGAVAVSCSSSGGGSNSAGQEGGPCYGNGSCNSGLTCLSHLCVNASEDGGPDVTASSSSGGSSGGGSGGSSGGSSGSGSGSGSSSGAGSSSGSGSSSGGADASTDAPSEAGMSDAPSDAPGDGAQTCQQCIMNTTACTSQENVCNSEAPCVMFQNCIDSGMSFTTCQQMNPTGASEYTTVVMCFCQQSVCGVVCAGQGC